MDADVPPVATEREGLLAFLAQQRRVLRHAAFGLSEEQLRAAPTASALTIGGLLKHVAFTERGWIARVVGGPEPRADSEYGRQFTLEDGDTLAGLVTALDAAGAATEVAIAGIDDLGQAVHAPGVGDWSVRWVLLHLIEEVARHAGHADIIREAIDGAQGMALLAAAEGWPESPSLKPWRAKENG